MFADLENTAKLTLGLEYDENNIIEEKAGTKHTIYLGIKRIIDICAGLVGCLLLIPIILIVKIINICNGDFAPVIYSQMRIGLNGKEFKFYKFRSMVPDADKQLVKILREGGDLAKEYRRYKKFKNDPRITKVGHFLRKTSIDELPQLYNVLKGDMSLVGNRPYIPREKEDMGKYFDDIVKTKPGLTGFWQACIRSRSTFDQRLEMEKYYSNNASLRFDIKILFKTIGVVLGQKDAR